MHVINMSSILHFQQQRKSQVQMTARGICVVKFLWVEDAHMLGGVCTIISLEEAAFC